jgi:2-phosphoglycerate kinase
MSGAKPENVFWLGGSPCAGKSSISEILAGGFGLDVYHVDEAFASHASRLDPALHPALTKWETSSWDERWMQPTESLLRDAVACYREHLGLILEDIISTQRRRPLLVEGTALLPRQVAALLTDRRQAVWVVPTPRFQREHYSRRVWVRETLRQCSNPESAFQNWMERDTRFADWVRAEARELNLELLEVDGGRTIEENALAVATHFRLVAGSQ